MTFETSSFDENYRNEISPENMGDKVLLSDFGKSCWTYKVNLHGKWVVLKRIKPEYIGNSIIEKSFDKEFEIGFTLDHPHIVKYLNKGNDKEGNYIITEYVDGKTLRELLTNGTVFSQKQIKQFFIQLLEATTYLHKKNIFHLDIKPENILISDKTGNVKLIDFGFSYSDGQVPVSSGTKKYTSKEQALYPDKVNYKNDLYSIGIVIIELFTGTTEPRVVNKLPFRFKKAVKRCLNADSDNHFTSEDALQLLNNRKLNPLVFLFFGVISIIGIIYILKKDHSINVDSELKNKSAVTNWKALPVMPKGRADGAAIYFNEKIYYISGAGADGGLITNDVFEFDIKTKTYTSKKHIQTARAEIAAVELNGKIYTFGGWVGNATTDTSEVYDIKLNEWSYLKPLPKKLTSLSVCALKNKIYILGGTLNVTNTYFYEFNPLLNTYKQLTVFPHSRNNACLAVVNDLIYAIGGNSYNNDNYFAHNNCDVYNAITNSWEQKTSLPEALTRGSAVAIGNEIHYLGGLSRPNSITDADALNTHYIYDTKTDVWRNGENLPYRVFSNECVAVQNVIYSFGGYEVLPNATGKSFLLNIK